MTAYLISDIAVRDRTAFEVYRTRAAGAIRTYGGRYLARLGEVQVPEGSWNPNMIVVVEFPSLEQARARYRSTEYAFALEEHDKALSRNPILVDGVSQPAARAQSDDPPCRRPRTWSRYVQNLQRLLVFLADRPLKSFGKICVLC